MGAAGATGLGVCVSGSHRQAEPQARRAPRVGRERWRGRERDAQPAMADLAISCHLCYGHNLNGGVRMESMNISLPEPLKQFVDGQISTGRYSSASEYVRELIRADEKRKAEEELEAKLLEGLRSPESELTRADWKAIQSEALARR
jgi:antitoxin ParD1/3/4